MLYSFVRQFGLQDSVMTLDELSSGDDVKDTGVVTDAPPSYICQVCVSQPALHHGTVIQKDKWPSEPL